MARIRTVKPEFFDDEKLATCSRDARLTFLGIISQSDDYGVAKGSPAWLRGRIFPYDNIPLKTMSAWIAELEGIGVVRCFNAEGETFVAIKNWDRHQKVDRPSNTRNPEAPKALWNRQNTCPHEASSNIHRGLDEGSLLDQDQDQDRDQDQESNMPGAPAPAQQSPQAADAPVVLLPTNRANEVYPVSRLERDEFSMLYPGVDVDRELLKMRAWLLSNQVKRKTRQGMPRFINGWLSKEQDKPKKNGTSNDQLGKRGATPDPAEYARLAEQLNI